MATKNIIKFDVMMKDRYICTMQMPLGLNYLKGYEGDKPVFDVPFDAFRGFVEQKRPSLKGKRYHIEFVTKQTKDLWRN
jgi:hypothetical protein